MESWGYKVLSCGFPASVYNVYRLLNLEWVHGVNTLINVISFV